MFLEVLGRYFNEVHPEEEFVDQTYNALSELNFSAENTIACIGVCRDEISQPLVELINDRWGYAFNMSSLAGMFLAGLTGLKASMHHAPNMDGKERYIFYSFPHIAIDGSGKIGVCNRVGRESESSACGALGAIQKELTAGPLNTELDNDDIELSLMKSRLAREITDRDIPDLLELTKVVQKAIQDDLEAALSKVVDPGKCDYAVIAGIQIHGPDQNYISPVSMYAIVEGERQELEIAPAAKQA